MKLAGPLTELFAALLAPFLCQRGNVTIKGLRDKRFTLGEEAAGILKKASEDSRDILKADEEEHYQKVHAEIDALTKNIELREKQETLEAKLAEPQVRRAEPNPVTGGEDRASHPAGESFAVSRMRRGQEESAEALRSWFLAGSPHRPNVEAFERAKRVGLDLNQKQLVINLSTRAMKTMDPSVPWEYRTAQGVGSGAIGLYTVPDEAMRPLEVALLAFGGMRQAATVIRTTSGADLPFPLVDDTSNVGALVGENTTQTELGITFTQLVLNAYKYTSKYILVSVELLQDSAINVPEYIGQALGQRIGRITNTHFTVGDGSSKPRGIVPAATLGKTGASGQTTTIIYADLVDLEHSVNVAYRRPNGRWMMSDAMLKALKKLTDAATGRPLWQAGLVTREPDTLMGYPYIVNDDIAVPNASAKSLLFGDLSKYLVRDVTEIVLLRLDELFALYQQVCFLAFSRHDGDLLDAGTHPVKYYIHPAS